MKKSYRASTVIFGARVYALYGNNRLHLIGLIMVCFVTPMIVGIIEIALGLSFFGTRTGRKTCSNCRYLLYALNASAHRDINIERLRVDDRWRLLHSYTRVCVQGAVALPISIGSILAILSSRNSVWICERQIKPDCSSGVRLDHVLFLVSLNKLSLFD